MGVKGLTPFLKKIHPDIFTELPSRFEAFKGKRIVIDGTLLTQRFHFARIEHPYRHVLGWFKLVRELKEHGVSAVCVFDGKERSVAKARETERRDAIRQLARIRGSIEQERLERLHKLQESIHMLHILTKSDRNQVLKKLNKASFTNLDDTEILLRPDVLEGQERRADLAASEEEEAPKPTSPQPLSEPIIIREISTEPMPPKETVLIEEVPPNPMPLEESISGKLPAEPMPSQVIPKESTQLPTEPIAAQEGLPYPAPVEQAPPVTISADDAPEAPECLEQVAVESIPLDEIPAPSMLVSQTPAGPISVEEEFRKVVSVEQALIDATGIEEVLAEMEQMSMTSISAEDIPEEELKPPEQAPIGSVSAEQPVIETAPAEIAVDKRLEEYIPTKQKNVEDDPGMFSLPVQGIDLDQLTARIESLKADYEAAVASLTSLAPGTNGLTEETQIEKMKADQRLTKSQNELAMQEDKLWTDFVASLGPSSLENDETIEEDINTLLDQSQVMAQSFQHRSNAPVPRTYQECKEILRAMGIPCIDATGAIEAEGLASSMVLEGLADYVASEDSDVLIYDVPLIRGISHASEPLVTVSGSEIRNALNLDREAFIDFALLLGTDFTERINNIGPVRAYQLIKDYGCIEDVLTAIEDNPRYKLKIPIDAYLAQVNIARKIFNTPPYTPPPESLHSIQQDDEKVAEVLERYNLTHALMNDSNEAQEKAIGQNLFSDNPEA